jgi:hypothetical protein
LRRRFEGNYYTEGLGYISRTGELERIILLGKVLKGLFLLGESR